jgi:hypothetical protein
MSWFAIADRAGAMFDPHGLGVQRQSAPVLDASDDSLLVRGSLVIETRLSPGQRPQPLLLFEQEGRWALKISLQAIPGGGIIMILSQGEDIQHCAVNQSDAGRTDVLRITYTWDSLARRGFVAVERTERDQLVMVPLKDPKPLRVRDLKALFSENGKLYLDEDLIYLAASTEIEPVGPMPTMSVDTPIATPDGYRRIGELKRGDTVFSNEGLVVPVLHQISRTVPARGSFVPVRVRAPYFGLQRDVLVAPSQRLVITGSEVEYLFGQEAVLVPVCHLSGGSSAIPVSGHATITYSQLLLPGHEALVASGAEVESLNIGRLRRKPKRLAASMFSDFDRSSLPDHGQSLYPVLRAFDSIVLAEHRAA